MTAADLTSFRSFFPHTNGGLTWLNHAATSPLSTRVLGAMNAHLQERSTGPIDTYFKDLDKIAALRAAVARVVNAESPDRIAFALNTSDALNVVAAGLPWKEGDRIVLGDMEFPANVYPYRNLERRGVHLDTLACPDGRLTPEVVERAITPSTKAVAISAVQFLSGYRADLAAIGSLCRANNVLLLVDGIQAVGAVRVDVQAMKIDALGCGAQKWLMSPHGTGFVYVSERVQDMVGQAYLGWLSVADPWNFRAYGQALASSARRYEGGTLNYPGLHGMAGAIGMLEEAGIGTIEERVLSLTGRLIELLDSRGGWVVVSPRRREERSGIVTVRPGRPERAKQIFEALVGRKVIISLREGLLRISPHFYNTEAELDACVDALNDANA